MKRFVENVFMKKCLLLSLLFLFQSILLFSQERPLYTWRLHPSFQDIQKITGTSDVIFAASKNGLFSKRKDSPFNLLGKPQGLSDAGVGAMAYIEESQSLLIGYRSGIIDQITTQEIESDQSILNLDSRLTKSIYNVAYTSNQAFFASDLGVISYRIDRAQAQDIYRNIGNGAAPVSCFEVLVDHDSIFAFCDLGLFKGSIHQNLLDYTQWEKISDHAYNENTTALILDGSLYISSGDDYLIQMSTSGTLIDSIYCYQNINDLTVANESILVAAGNTIRQLNQDNHLLFHTSESEILSLHFDGSALWIGEQSLGLKLLDATTYILPSGPQSDQPSQIVSINEQMYLLDQSLRYALCNMK
jgi:hypothetical protein